MITFNDLIESVCISLNDFKEVTRQRVKLLVPLTVAHIMSKHQWECTITLTTITTSPSVAYVDMTAGDFEREIGLWRADLKKPLEYITPQEYAERRSQSTTPYSSEACKYTVMKGATNRTKRFYFLDPPSSAMTIYVLYNSIIDPNAVQDLPDEFIPVMKAHLIYQMTPPVLEVGGQKTGNPSFGSARDDYRSALSELIQHEQGNRGRLTMMELDDVAKNAYQYYHK